MKNSLIESTIIPAVNYHLWEPCNMRCKFCFATFQDVKKDILPKGHLPKEESLRLVEALGAFGFEKITFAGGEPTLCRWLPDLIHVARSYGMTTCVVTNGTNLNRTWLEAVRHQLDWVALSIDSISEETNIAAGRAVSGRRPLSKERYLSLAKDVRDFGFKLKINTVVSKFNFREDLNEFMLTVRPDRWKVLQALKVEGQNDQHFGAFHISGQEFGQFTAAHQESIRALGAVVETNEAIKGSYLMIDPAGRFFDNVENGHRYSSPLLEVGVAGALGQVQPEMKKFLSRGGRYDW